MLAAAGAWLASWSWEEAAMLSQASWQLGTANEGLIQDVKYNGLVGYGPL